ncbi:MAG: PilZ domain-containing protein, partial [Pyrinomonadaceae bacterium]
RSRLIIDVFFAGADETGVAHTTDISAGGLYMKTQAEIPEGALIMLRIPLGRDEQIMVNARVVYVSPGYGVGVRFEGMTDSDRSSLETAVASTA